MQKRQLTYGFNTLDGFSLPVYLLALGPEDPDVKVAMDLFLATTGVWATWSQADNNDPEPIIILADAVYELLDAEELEASLRQVEYLHISGLLDDAHPWKQIVKTRKMFPLKLDDIRRANQYATAHVSHGALKSALVKQMV